MQSRILTDDQIARIHNASLAILEKTGVIVPHEDMLNRFEDAGASVDRAGQRVRIPADLVALSVESAGKQFTLYGRDMKQTAAFGQGRRNYNSIAGEAHWLDEIGAQRRFATIDDVATAARFCDALPGINIVGAMADPHELAAAYRCVDVCATLLRNTTKPVTFWFHDRASAKYVSEILIALRGDERAAAQYPLCYPFLEPISPLRFPFNGIDLLYETARLNLPVPIGPMAQMGLSAPCTIAGTLAIENAEILAGVCITQLIRPGMGVCYGGICHAFDMRTTQMIFSGPEQAIFGVAMTQMGKRYGLPVYINVGLTDSKRPDAQAGMEAAATLALGAAAGADIFGHLGISGVDQAASLDMLILQHEVVRYVESLSSTVSAGVARRLHTGGGRSGRGGWPVGGSARDIDHCVLALKPRKGMSSSMRLRNSDTGRQTCIPWVLGDSSRACMTATIFARNVVPPSRTGLTVRSPVLHFSCISVLLLASPLPRWRRRRVGGIDKACPLHAGPAGRASYFALRDR